MALTTEQRQEIRRRIYDDLLFDYLTGLEKAIFGYTAHVYIPHMFVNTNMATFLNRLPFEIAKEMAILYYNKIKSLNNNTPPRPLGATSLAYNAPPEFLDSTGAVFESKLLASEVGDYQRIYLVFREIINVSERGWVLDNNGIVLPYVYSYPNPNKTSPLHNSNPAYQYYVNHNGFVQNSVFPDLFCDAVDRVETSLTAPLTSREVRDEACYLIKSSGGGLWFTASLGKMKLIDERMSVYPVSSRNNAFTNAFSKKVASGVLSLGQNTEPQFSFNYDTMKWTAVRGIVAPYCIVENLVKDSDIDLSFPSTPP